MNYRRKAKISAQDIIENFPVKAALGLGLPDILADFAFFSDLAEAEVRQLLEHKFGDLDSYIWNGGYKNA